MGLNGIRAKQSRRFRVTTDSGHYHSVAPNLLGRDFESALPNRKWLADITYIPTRQGWLYLAAVLDLYSRSIVGWAMSRRMTNRLADRALAMAVERRSPSPGLIHHSDRGRQYASAGYQRSLACHGMVCSMSRTGNCWDNAPMESFFHTLKTEPIHNREYQTRRQARADIFEYIEVFYNRSRRHSALGYMTPAQYERVNMLA